jgi:hypothetical protein
MIGLTYAAQEMGAAANVQPYLVPLLTYSDPNLITDWGTSYASPKVYLAANGALATNYTANSAAFRQRNPSPVLGTVHIAIAAYATNRILFEDEYTLDVRNWVTS